MVVAAFFIYPITYQFDNRNERSKRINYQSNVFINVYNKITIMDRDIYCEECGKFLFKTSKSSDGAAASEALDLGFCCKDAVLYGVSGVHFFCSKECNNKWFKDHTNQEQRDSGKKKFEELKQTMEESKPELIRGLQSIQTAFNVLKKRAKK